MQSEDKAVSVIKKGSIVECIDSSARERHLTKGKRYSVIAVNSSGEHIRVRGDDGDMLWNFLYRFKPYKKKTKVRIVL